MTCAEGCAEFSDFCASCWRERALAMERRAMEAEQRLKDAAKVSRQRTAERDEARQAQNVAQQQIGHERTVFAEKDIQLVRERDEALALLRSAQQERDDVADQHEDALQAAERERDEARGRLDATFHRLKRLETIRGVARRLQGRYYDLLSDFCDTVAGKRFAEMDCDEARQVAHELCFPPEGRTQAALREICEKHPWICRDKEPW